MQIDDVGFYNAFGFSPQPGTPTAHLHDDTPQEAKLRRLHQLQLQAVINASIARISECRLGAASRLEMPAGRGRARTGLTPLRHDRAANGLAVFFSAATASMGA